MQTLKHRHKLTATATATLALLLGASALGCAPEAGKVKGPPQGPFAVSDYFAASGAMGDGATPPRLTINENIACKEPRPAGARGNCFSFVHDPSLATTIEPPAASVLWSGLYWQYPANNWGTEPGLPLPAGLTKVTFQAAVAAGTTETVNFAAGGIGNPPDPAVPDLPHDDQFRQPLAATLNGDWYELEILLPAATPITELIGALTWSMNYSMTADPATAAPKTLYLDDIYYE